MPHPTRLCITWFVLPVTICEPPHYVPIITLFSITVGPGSFLGTCNFGRWSLLTLRAVPTLAATAHPGGPQR